MKKTTAIATLLGLVLLITPPLALSQSVDSDATGNGGEYVNRITVTWMSDGSGAVSRTVRTRVTGTILRVVFKPSAGNLQPTDLYDAVLTDESGFDLLRGLGANLSNSVTTSIV